MAATPLDYPVEPLPDEISHTVVHQVEGDLFKYSVRATDFEWSRSTAIDGIVIIEKYQQQLCRSIWSLFLLLRPRWKKVWSFSSSETTCSWGIIDSEGDSAISTRNRLTENTLNAGVVLTKLLLDKFLGPVENELRELQAVVERLRESGDQAATRKIA